MEAPSPAGEFFSLAMISLIAAGLVTYVGYSVSCSSKEGFAGPVAGAGTPGCLNTLNDAAKLSALLHEKPAHTSEGPDDLRELDLILSKLACFKRDLMGNGVVNATLRQPFSTAHDLEPVAETTARCLAKTIPQRDLQLGLDKWGTRGTFLIKRLCTAEALSDAEEKEAIRLFGSAMQDVNDVALGVCCNATAGAIIAGQPVGRSPGGFEPPSLNGLRDYKGYY